MESLLIAVTVISLGLAVTMSAVAWTLIKAERQRAAARIEALEALAFSDEPGREPTAEVTRATGTVAAPVGPSPALASRAHERAVTVAESDSDMLDWDAVIRAHAIEDGSRAETPARRHRVRAVLPEAMFGTEPASNAGTRRFAVVAAIGLVIAVAYAASSAMRSPEVAAALAVSTAPPDAEPQPLELLSLKHSPDANGGFTVSGFVQNPAGGRNLTNVEVVVYFFDYKDQYFTTGRAPLEVANMRTGTDSPFEVHVPSATHVGRYRVGFRQADGTVVAHIDRRGRFPEGTSETIVGADQVRPAGGMR